MRRRSLVSAIGAVIVVYIVVSGCGGSHAVQAADLSAATIAVDRNADEPVRWGSPTDRARATGDSTRDCRPTGRAQVQPADPST